MAPPAPLAAWQFTRGPLDARDRFSLSYGTAVATIVGEADFATQPPYTLHWKGTEPVSRVRIEQSPRWIQTLPKRAFSVEVWAKIERSQAGGGLVSFTPREGTPAWLWQSLGIGKCFFISRFECGNV